MVRMVQEAWDRLPLYLHPQDLGSREESTINTTNSSWQEATLLEPLQGVNLSAQMTITPNQSPAGNSTPTRGTPKIKLNSPENTLYCPLCKKKFSNEQTFKAHENGTKHQKALRQARGSLSPMKQSPKKESSVSPLIQQSQQQFEAQGTKWESLVTTKPNQAFKGLFLTAQDLLKENHIRNGATWLHRLMYHLEQSCAMESVNDDQSFLQLMPVGRALLYLKASLMLSRIFQLPGVMACHEMSVYYCTQAVACFVSPQRLRQWEQESMHVPLSVAMQSGGEIYEEIKSSVPYNYASKDPEADPQHHDIYAPLYSTLLEVAAIQSFYSPSSTSITLYLIALAAAKQERQFDDEQNVLEQLVVVRDALAFPTTTRPVIHRATGEECNRVVFRWKWAILERMNGRIALEERMELFRVTGDERWMIECYLLALARYDSVAVQQLQGITTKEMGRRKFVPLVDILRFLAEHWVAAHVSEFMQVECLPLWDEECQSFPLLNELYYNLLFALTE